MFSGMAIPNASDSSIPEGFPIAASAAALAGMQPKLGLVERDGRFFSTWSSGPLQQYLGCREAVQALSNQIGRTSRRHHGRLLVEALKDLRRRRLFSEDQNVWVLRHVAEVLSCGLPALPTPSDEYTTEITDSYLVELRQKSRLTPRERLILDVDEEYRLKNGLPPVCQGQTGSADRS